MENCDVTTGFLTFSNMRKGSPDFDSGPAHVARKRKIHQSLPERSSASVSNSISASSEKKLAANDESRSISDTPQLRIVHVNRQLEFVSPSPRQIPSAINEAGHVSQLDFQLPVQSNTNSNNASSFNSQTEAESAVAGVPLQQEHHESSEGTNDGCLDHNQSSEAINADEVQQEQQPDDGGDDEAATLRLVQQLMEQEELNRLREWEEAQMQQVLAMSQADVTQLESEDADLAMALRLQREEGGLSQDVAMNLGEAVDEAAQAEGEEAAEGQVLNVDDMDYEQLLSLGQQLGDVKKERWALVCEKHIKKLPTFSFNPKLAKGKLA